MVLWPLPIQVQIAQSYSKDCSLLIAQDKADGIEPNLYFEYREAIAALLYNILYKEGDFDDDEYNGSAKPDKME